MAHLLPTTYCILLTYYLIGKSCLKHGQKYNCDEKKRRIHKPNATACAHLCAKEDARFFTFRGKDEGIRVDYLLPYYLLVSFFTFLVGSPISNMSPMQPLCSQCAHCIAAVPATVCWCRQSQVASQIKWLHLLLTTDY